MQHVAQNRQLLEILQRVFVFFSESLSRLQELNTTLSGDNTGTSFDIEKVVSHNMIVAAS